MKCWIIVLLFPCAVEVSNAYGQEPAPTAAPAPPAVAPASPAVAPAPPARPEQERAPSRSVNIRANPLGLLFGIGALEVDIRITDSFALGPSGQFASATVGDVSQTALGGGLRGTYYPRARSLDGGLIVSPFAAALQVKSTSSGMAATTVTAIRLGCLAGWQWMWGSGFNINLGAGLQYVGLAVSDEDFNDDEQVTIVAAGVGLAAEFTIGYAF